MAETDLLGEREQAALALARGLTSDRAGQEAGVSGRTVRRWREDAEFEALVNAARRTILAECVSALGAAARDAVDVLHSALRDDSPALRVRAALGVLSALPSLREHLELDERLARLEHGDSKWSMSEIDGEIARLQAQGNREEWGA